MGAFLGQFFMNPLFVVGAASAAMPLVIHLIHRRKAPKVLFSTLRFLRVSNERTARRRRLQDVFLLLLRALICALPAIALARPFLPASGRTGGPVAAAIVLDNSLSMSAEDDGEPRFAVAKEAALEILRDLGGKATVALILTNPPRDHPAPVAAADLSVVEKGIVGSSVSAAKGSLPAAIERARWLLEKTGEPNKQVLVISDMQKNSWAAPPGKNTPSEIPVIIVDCGSSDTSNAAVTDVNIRARSRVEGEPVTIEARLLNFGPRAVSRGAVLYIDGEARDRRRLTLAPGVPAAASFTYTFNDQGTYPGWVVIEDDRLETDNLRSFTIAIQPQLKVLIIQDEKSRIGFTDDSFYLVKALDPLGGAEGRRSPIRPVRALTAAAEREKLSDYDAVCLVNVRRISEGLAELLKEYVRRGGGLVIFAGDNADPRHYSEMLADPAGGLMAAEFGPILGDADDHTQFRRITRADYTHPLLTRFKGEGIFGDVRVFQYMSVRVAGRSGARLLSLADGSPFLLENKYGGGVVLMFTCSAAPDWSNFPLKQAFLPLLHEIVYYVRRSESMKESYPVGGPVRLRFPDTLESLTVEITDPAGKTCEVKSTPSTESNVAVFDQTDTPGLYSWRAGRRAGAFAVNPDTRESDLKRSDPAAVRDACGSKKVFVVSSSDEMRETLKRLREGLPLMDYFFLLVLAIAAFECFFSNWLTPAAPAEPRKNGLGVVGAPPGSEG